MLLEIGREILIKLVIQVIPSYFNKGGCRGINWMCWDKLTMNKEWGDIGLRDLYEFNPAMLGK